MAMSTLQPLFQYFRQQWLVIGGAAQFRAARFSATLKDRAVVLR